MNRIANFLALGVRAMLARGLQVGLLSFSPWVVGTDIACGCANFFSLDGTGFAYRCVKFLALGWLGDELGFFSLGGRGSPGEGQD